MSAATFPRHRSAFAKEWPRFSAWLLAHGSEIRTPSNSYELARFTTPHGVGVIYRNRSGAVTNWGGGADEAWIAFRTGAEWRVGDKVKRDRSKRKRQHRINTLIERDGQDCWFCGRPLAEDITLEHLVAVVHGGPDHPSNIVLAHSACNGRADHLSVAEKVRLRECMRAELAGVAA